MNEVVTISQSILQCSISVIVVGGLWAGCKKPVPGPVEDEPRFLSSSGIGCDILSVTLTAARSSFHLPWTPTLPSGGRRQSHQRSRVFSNHCFLWACLCQCEVWTTVSFSWGLSFPARLPSLCLIHRTCFVKVTHLTVVLSRSPRPSPGSVGQQQPTGLI